MKYAPFVVPTLCRSEHFIRMMESLKRNSWACYTDVIVSVDFPPSDKYRKGWLEICNYLDHGDFSDFKELIVFKQTKNLGAGKNSSFLQDYVRKNYDRWINCDDDCEFSPNFLEFMDKCLDAFEDDPNVFAVTAYSYPVEWSVSDGVTCMKQQFNTATWGLGRWKEKNTIALEYIRSGKMLDDAEMVINSKRYKKMISRCYVQYFNQVTSARNGLMKGFMTNMTDVGMRAYLACQDKYCISPILSKVRNHGFDGSGLYCHEALVVDNTKAATYDYQHQPIDGSEHFDIILNDSALHEANRKKLDAFDAVSKRSLWYTKTKFLIIKCCGLKFARKLDDVVVATIQALGLRKR